MDYGSAVIVSSKGVYNRYQSDETFGKFVLESIGRYFRCDWGDLCPEDRQLNEEALIHGDRIFAAYVHPDDPETKIWIITESDRSVTTILFPEEY